MNRKPRPLGSSGSAEMNREPRPLGSSGSRKGRNLAIIALIYILAFVVGILCSYKIENQVLKFLVFDVVATIVTYIFSVILKNSSVYDAYWSLTPMIMSVWLFAENSAFSPMQILFLIVFNVWSLRLTLNWVEVFTDFSYEDWRYKKFRDESNRFLWPVINFWGIHMMPTVIVFLGMLPMFIIANTRIGILSIFGIIVMLFGICLEFFADKQMHSFLQSENVGQVCKLGLWRVSRHPNYLGEISFWFGVYLVMLPYAVHYWFLGVGALSVFILFNVVSIPLMEKRQLSRRPEYAQYKKETSRLFLMPVNESLSFFK